MDTQTPILPVWIRPNQATKIYGVSRSMLYVWIAAGLIKSTTSRVDARQRYGARLINRASLEDFLEARASGGDATVTDSQPDPQARQLIAQVVAEVEGLNLAEEFSPIMPALQDYLEAQK